jgi:hypothetical protein
VFAAAAWNIEPPISGGFDGGWGDSVNLALAMEGGVLLPSALE